jgi:hypothetical protein
MQSRLVDDGYFPLRQVEMMGEHVGDERATRAGAEHNDVLHFSLLKFLYSGLRRKTSRSRANEGEIQKEAGLDPILLPVRPR